MITIIITAYGEPKSTEKAINSILKNNIKEPFKIIVCDPFPEVEEYIQNKFGNNKKIEFFLDPGEGKSYALNLLIRKNFSENKEDIIISTDGDVYLGENTINELLEPFKNPEVGIVCGHPVSINKRDNMLGYWSHLAFDEMNKTRKKLAKKKEFFEI